MKTEHSRTLELRAPTTETQAPAVYRRSALAGVLRSGPPKADITAIVDGTFRYSMVDLLERARDIAAALSAVPDGPVAVALPLGFEQIASCLAALGSRRTFLCIDPRDPAPFVEGILTRIQPAIVLTSGNPDAVFDRSSGIVVRVGSVGRVADELLDFDAAFSDLDRPAAVFFTSGSTGDTKGVASSVGALLAKTAGYPWKIGDRTIAHASPMFRVSTNEWLVPVLAGATVHIVDARGGVESIVSAVEAIRPTRFRCNASLLRLVANAIGNREPVRGVRELRFDGGVVDIADLVAARQVFPDASMSVSFSSSECGEIGAFSLTVDEGVPTELLFTPSCEVELRNVDESGVGEVWAKSVQQATGYVRNGRRQVKPTIEAISDPSGFVRSGDLGRFHADGRIEVIGRNDDLVKIRGFRVHPAETERALRSHLSLGEVIVVPRSLGLSGRLRLVAFCEPSDRHRRPQPALLLAALRDELAAASVPSQLVLVDHLPLLPTGKVDRVAVAQLAVPRRQLEEDPPITHTEAAVIDAWERVLGQAPIGRNEKFVGTCVGGLLCRPLALHLERLGVRLGPTVLIDTKFSYRSDGATPSSRERMSRLVRRAGREQARHTIRSLAADPLGHSRRIVHIFRRTARPASDLVHMVSQPDLSTSPTTLVMNSTWHAEQRLLGWDRRADGWQVVEIEGTHESLLITGREKTLAAIRVALAM